MMKKIITLCLLMSLGFISYSQTKKTVPTKAAPAKSTPVKEDPSKKLMDTPPSLSDEEVNAKWMAYMTPGEVHNMLASQVGDWSEEITIWTHEGAQPMNNKAMVKVEMILGGRYQQSTHNGEFAGMPFEGVGITAFDNASKKYYSTWIDNMGTGIMFNSGTVDPKTNAIVFYGEQPDPLTGKMTKIREVLSNQGEATINMEMYTTPSGGKEFMSMKIMMKR